MIYQFTVEGKLRGKERPRRGKHGGMYTPKTTVEYEESIRQALANAYSDTLQEVEVMHRPFWLYITAIKAPTKKSVKDGTAGKPGSPCCAKPDGDNIAKAILDALNGVLWVDDSQCAGLTVSKEWGRAGEQERIDVEVHDMDDDWSDPDVEEDSW